MVVGDQPVPLVVVDKVLSGCSTALSEKLEVCKSHAIHTFLQTTFTGSPRWTQQLNMRAEHAL